MSADLRLVADEDMTRAIDECSRRVAGIFAKLYTFERGPSSEGARRLGLQAGELMDAFDRLAKLAEKGEA